MNEQKKRFDEEFKRLWRPEKDRLGYLTKSGQRYDDLYYSREAFAAFVEEMRENYPEHYARYATCSGDELEEHYDRRSERYYPPKMASVASSSRWVYLALRAHAEEKLRALIPDLPTDGIFRFEEKLQIKGVRRGIANLDSAYLSDESCVFIEAKCHEIFDRHELKWSKQYIKSGRFADEGEVALAVPPQAVSIVTTKTDDVIKEVVRVAPAAFGLEDENPRFDAKQAICHLLGIASREGTAPADLLYLLFRPSGLVGSSEVYEQFEKEYRGFCESDCIRAFCERHRISLRLVYVTEQPTDDALVTETRYRSAP
ncbi:MAG: hypothetical protein IJT69_00425 [Clostridia bacterium]|nr:hypothetical protein [Clostridia bacterium]